MSSEEAAARACAGSLGVLSRARPALAELKKQVKEQQSTLLQSMQQFNVYCLPLTVPETEKQVYLVRKPKTKKQPFNAALVNEVLEQVLPKAVWNKKTRQAFELRVKEVRAPVQDGERLGFTSKPPGSKKRKKRGEEEEEEEGEDKEEQET